MTTTAAITRSELPGFLLNQTWRMDPAHTSVEFAVKHLMITTVKGRFADLQGQLHLDPSISSGVGLSVEIQAKSIDTRVPQRDDHLRSADFLEVEKYPVITFIGKRMEGDATDRFRLIGDVTIRGVTREIALEVTYEGHTSDPWGGERVGFSATARLNRKDFGLHWNQVLETGGWVVGDDVRISIDTELVKEAPARAA